MTFEINIKDKSLKFISTLQKHDRERLKEAILVLKQITGDSDRRGLSTSRLPLIQGLVI